MKIREIGGHDVILTDQAFLRREEENEHYLMELDSGSLLYPYDSEAVRPALHEWTNPYGGWEAPTCQLRGHFLGHWLSAAAMRFDETGSTELKAKADAIVDELAKCQSDNGGQWAASIPEKYLYRIGEGKAVWAPQYTIHKLFMGLLDMYLYAGNKKALDIADNMADWFLDWSGRYTREEFNDILDVETGGMLEIWAELLEITGEEKYKTLLERYYRERLFDPLLAGADVLTNMHANTTIPEILGCARAYEVTGEKKWLDIVAAYWKCAVTERGMFATGGQTQGEIWTPKMKLKSRLGDKNQEHCTVYNMMRLAEFLFLVTGEAGYLQYREYNLYNGIFAQTYWRKEKVNGVNTLPDQGLLTYFLPMKAPARKNWAGRTDSFFCCHGTMVQANAALNRGIYYSDGNRLIIGQYVDSEMTTEIDGQKVTLLMKQNRKNGEAAVSDSVNNGRIRPDDPENAGSLPKSVSYILTLKTGSPVSFSILFRIPEWIAGEAKIEAPDGKVYKAAANTVDGSGFCEIRAVFHDNDRIKIDFPIGLSFIPLPDDPDTGAFRYGPEVLVGLCDSERVLKITGDDPAKEFSNDRERQWGTYQISFRSETQDPGITLIRLNEVGYQEYQMYFHVLKKD
ncbi:MAG: glycoside hydrolase family 127 protein [Lachnospiraceae bacterium]|jgi:DUF1680 family protein|nr:glycoside hydrolase family 127 protein [Lachnospiraceae bacterium]